MAFVDELAYDLFLIGFAGFILSYTSYLLYSNYRSGRREVYSLVDGALAPLLLLGIYMTAAGVYQQLTWPLPGSYNLLFYDPFVSFGLVLLALSISIYLKKKIHYTGFFSLAVGLMTMLYGVFGYLLGLTKAPLELLALYLAFGGAGVLAYPVSLMTDAMQDRQKKFTTTHHAALLLFCIILLLGSALAVLMGALSIQSHLASAP